jgi:hypothetical protein
MGSPWCGCKDLIPNYKALIAAGANSIISDLKSTYLKKPVYKARDIHVIYINF